MSVTSETLQAPFPWFGGKSRVSDLIWSRFGDVPNYVEPFFGSGAVLLRRPHYPFDESVIRRETINDYDGHVANFWRAVQSDPDAVAAWCDWPVNEIDLKARGDWLYCRPDSRAFVERMRAEPDYYCAKTAGWWVWFCSNWIGGLPSVDGNSHMNRDGVHMTRPHLSGPGQGVNRQRPHLGGAGRGVKRQRPHLSTAGQGVNRQRPHLSTAGQGVKRQRPHLGDAGRGVSRQLPHLGDAGKGACDAARESLVEWMRRLADRLRRVRVCCGDWSRVTGKSVTWNNASPCGVFLDPPYADTAGRDENLYSTDCLRVAHDVREWAIEQGQRPDMRIALCGYEGEHAMPPDWECVPWKASGGFAHVGNSRGKENCHRERIWFSPACLRPKTGGQATLRF